MTGSVCPLEPSFEMMARFLHLLGGEKEIFTGFFLDPLGKKPIPGYGCVHGNCGELVELAQSVWNQCQGSFHVCLNRTDLNGRKKKNIQSARVLVVDLDKQIGSEVVAELIGTYKPYMWVESSPAKWHFYWKCEDYDLKTWSLHQGALAYGCDADPNLSDTTKTLRVPGIPRLTKEGEWFVPFLFWQDEDPDTDTDTVREVVTPSNAGSVFPFLFDAIEAVKENSSSVRKTMRTALHNGDLETIAACSRAGTGRNATVFTAVKMASSKPMQPEMTEEAAVALAESLNSEFGLEAGGPLEEEELLKTARSGLAHGLELRAVKRERIRERMGVELEETEQHVNGEMASSEVHNLAGSEESGSELGSTRGPLFPYDYTAYDLQNRFTEAALVERCLQRFGDSMIRVGNLIYAFDARYLVWRKQKARDQHEIVTAFMWECQRDLIEDPEFLTSQCLTSEGEFSETKHNQAVSKFMSTRINCPTVGQIFGSERVPRGTLDQFDSDPKILHVANGVLNLETLELEEASQKHLFLHQSDVAWNPQADFTWWQTYLEEVFAHNEDPEGMVCLMNEIFGYSLTGSVEAQKIFIHYGLNLNGKSKVLEALRILTGEYSTMVMGATLTRRENGIEKEFERIGAKVEGKRLVVVDDLDVQTQWNEAAAKVLTGPKITARKLYEEERDIPNRAKFHIGCNQPPKAEGASAGILRRLCIIPYRRIFEQSTSKEHEIRNNLQKYKEGILLWAAIGAQQVIKNNWNLNYPAETETELEEYRQENFVIEGVIHELFKRPTGEGAWYSNDQLLRRLNDEARTRGGRNEKIDGPMLGRILKDRLGIESCRAINSKNGKKCTYYLVEPCIEQKD